VILIVPAKLIEMKNNTPLRRLFPVGDTFRDPMVAWIYSFIAVLNISISIMVFYIHSLTNQNEIESSEYNLFFYVVPVLLVVWVIGLLYLLAGKMKQVKTGTV
jgi:Na+/melibiose symporter-like transporter